jgi:hypothetical protein
MLEEEEGKNRNALENAIFIKHFLRSTAIVMQTVLTRLEF